MSQFAGGWSPYEPLTKEDQIIFDEAIQSILGVDYSPTAVSKQIVNGTNFRFKCNASRPPSYVMWEAIVEIHQPIGEAPFVTGITRV